MLVPYLYIMRTLNICSLISCMLIMISISHIGVAQTAKAETDVAAIMKRYEAIGLSVAVVKDGRITYTNTFGYKDIDTKTPIAKDDIFRIASISKSFTATSLMQLVEAKKISLDDDFGKLVGFPIRNPKFPKTVITLRMVLSHTSSLNDSQGYFNLDVINPAKGAEWAKCYNDYEPGKGYQYCNLNFNMAGAVLEKLSGERFDQYVKHHILDPLKLYGGYCVDSLNQGKFVTLYAYDTATKKYTASPLAYAPRHEELRNYIAGYTTPVLSPTGGMKISATELARYMCMHMYMGKFDGVRIISKKSSKIMQTPVDQKEGYGLALHTMNDVIPGEKMMGHTGTAYGQYSVMIFSPDKKFGIVAMTNGCNTPDTDDLNPMLKEIVNTLYSSIIQPK
jgi:CubicO group peptidase (beta-lactamase class C family)